MLNVKNSQDKNIWTVWSSASCMLTKWNKVFFIYCALHVSLILASNVRLTFVHDNSKALFFTGNKVHNGRTRSFRGNNRIEIGCITFKPLKK